MQEAVRKKPPGSASSLSHNELIKNSNERLFWLGDLLVLFEKKNKQNKIPEIVNSRIPLFRSAIPCAVNIHLCLNKYPIIFGHKI